MKALLVLLAMIFGAWIVIQLLPDIQRYMRISTM
jgi:hypothetical protein